MKRIECEKDFLDKRREHKLKEMSLKYILRKKLSIIENLAFELTISRNNVI